MNACSLLCHLDEVQSFVLSHRPDILAVSWLDPCVPDSEVSLSGYHEYRCDRSRSSGGIDVYVDEYLWLSISSFKSSKGCFAFGCFYRPPNLPASSVDGLCTSTEAMLVSHKHVVACGDLNIDFLDNDHAFTKSLQNFILSCSLSCPITAPTRISANQCSALDYLLCSSGLSISQASVIHCSISDHLPIHLSIDWSSPSFQPKTITNQSFNNYSLKVSPSIILSPLASILNSSISTSTFLLSWKCGYIRPLHKGGNWDCPNNHSPISVLIMHTVLTYTYPLPLHPLSSWLRPQLNIVFDIILLLFIAIIISCRPSCHIIPHYLRSVECFPCHSLMKVAVSYRNI